MKIISGSYRGRGLPWLLVFPPSINPGETLVAEKGMYFWKQLCKVFFFSFSLYFLLLPSFLLLLLRQLDINSIEEMPPSDWSVGRSVGIFFNYWYRRTQPTEGGSGLYRETEQAMAKDGELPVVSASVPAFGFLSRLPQRVV